MANAAAAAATITPDAPSATLLMCVGIPQPRPECDARLRTSETGVEIERARVWDRSVGGRHVTGEKKVFRSKGIVERNLPRWFRKPGFKAWDDFVGYFRSLPKDADAALVSDAKELEDKGDDAQPKVLLRLMKHYNKSRKFSRTEVAPPWFFVEAQTRTDLPPEDAWTIDVATNLDHERSQQKSAAKTTPAPGSERSRPAKAEQEPSPNAAATAEAAPEPPATGVVPPPTNDKGWSDALRRLPSAIQLLVDGRGKNVSELNERRKRAIELAQVDRIHNLAQHGAEVRRGLLEWLAERRRDATEIEAEVRKRLESIDGWITEQLGAARAKVPALDEHALADLRVRLRRLYPKLPDENLLSKLTKQALDAARPRKLESWAKKVIDDFNNSRGSAAEKVRDPWLLDGLLRWLSQRPNEDTPTDGEIYDQIQRLGGPNLAARKRRNEGPRPPKQPERKADRHPNEGDDEEEASPPTAQTAQKS
jgi:hypothetical protein